MALVLLGALPLLGAPITVTVSPKPATVNPSGSITFTATVTGTTNTAVTWTVSAGGGSFSPTSTSANPNETTYTAPALAGTYTVTATSVANTQKKGTSTVTVPIVVAVNPQTITMDTSSPTAFTATVTGATNTGVTWTVSAGGGSFSPSTTSANPNSTTYTAPSTVGTYTVTATSVANTSKNATATVTTVLPILVTISPKPVSLEAGDSVAFSATVTNTPNTAVTWSATGGTITSTGVYTAPSSPGTYTVTATSVANTAKKDTATVTVASAITVTVNPNVITLDTLASATFTATVANTANTAVTWSATGGSITTGGVYTAPSAAGTYYVTATSAANPKRKGTATVTVGTSTLEAFWQFDAGIGTTTTDSTGHANTGTLVGGVTWVDGKAGKAVHFDGVANSYVSVPTANRFLGQFTFSAWVKFDAVNRGTDNPIFSLGANYSTPLRLMEAAGKAYIYSYYGVNFTGATPLVANVWTHLAYVHDGSQIKLYVNGVLDSTVNAAYFSGRTTDAAIGRAFSGPYGAETNLLGSIDEVRVYTRALSAAEISALYAPASSVTVTIAPRDLTLTSSSSQAFTATVTGDANTAVTWELPDNASGTITSAGLYTAPATLPSEGVVYRIVARSQADPAQTDTVYVTVKSPVYVAPKSVTVAVNGTAPFTATVTGQANTDVTWSTNGGSISATGVYTAPPTQGTYTVTATSVGDPTKTGTATVMAVETYADLAAHFPMDEGAGTQITDAAGSGTVGTFSDTGGWGGLPQWALGKNGSGLKFISVGDSRCAVSLNPQVTLGSAWTISIWFRSPLDSNLNVQRSFTTNNSWDAHIAVHPNGQLGTIVVNNWNFIGFNLNSLSAGWHQVTAVGQNGTTQFFMDGAAVGTVPVQSQAAIGSIGGSTGGSLYSFSSLLDEVRIFRRALSTAEVAGLFARPFPESVLISISPTSPQVMPGASQAFTATVTGSANTAVTWYATGGTISSTGVYTAPAKPGSYSVIATSVADPTKTAIATVTVPVPTIYAYFPMDEGAGTQTFDAAGSGTVGALGNTNSNPPLWTAGKAGTALDFSRTDNPGAYGSVVVVLRPVPALGTAWTLSAWFKVPLPYRSPELQSITFGYVPGYQNTHIAVSGSRLGTYYGGSGTSNFGDSGFDLATLSAGWHQVTAVGQNGTTQFYLDGVAGALVPFQLLANVETIGGADNAGKAFGGAIDGFRIYRRALTPTEAAALFTPVNVTLSPTYVALAPGAPQTFAATVTGNANTAVTWSATGGTVSSTGVYTAPATPGAYTVTAASVADPSSKASAAVVVSPSSFPAIPAGSWLDVSGTWVDSFNQTFTLFQNAGRVFGTRQGQQFEATLSGYRLTGELWEVGNQVSNRNFVWNFAPDGSSFSGLLGPGTSTPNTGWTGLRQSGVVSILADPTSLFLNTLEEEPIQVLVAGSSNKAITWTIPAGQVSARDAYSYWYTPPATAGTYTLTVTSAADPTKVATITATVVAHPSVTVDVDPAFVELGKNGTATFSALVQGTANTTVTWSATGGSITSGGAYTAPNAFGTYVVTAISAADPNVKASATVEVSAQAGTDKTFTYDENGNLTGDGDRTFEWDGENRLVAVVITATGHRIEFSYDEMGMMDQIVEMDGAVVTSEKQYLWDGSGIAEEHINADATITKRFYGQGFTDTDGTNLFYTRDHLGSIRELTDGTQAVRARYDYDPYGRMTKLSGDRDAAFLYTGHLWHAASGLNLAPFRAYDPNLGRWISRDPSGEVNGMNLYAYVSGNPITKRDPLGLWELFGSGKETLDNGQVVKWIGIGVSGVPLPDRVGPCAGASLVLGGKLGASFGPFSFSFGGGKGWKWGDHTLGPLGGTEDIEDGGFKGKAKIPKPFEKWKGKIDFGIGVTYTTFSDPK